MEHCCKNNTYSYNTDSVTFNVHLELCHVLAMYQTTWLITPKVKCYAGNVIWNLQQMIFTFTAMRRSYLLTVSWSQQWGDLTSSPSADKWSVNTMCWHMSEHCESSTGQLMLLGSSNCRAESFTIYRENWGQLDFHCTKILSYGLTST